MGNRGAWGRGQEEEMAVHEYDQNGTDVERRRAKLGAGWVLGVGRRTAQTPKAQTNAHTSPGPVCSADRPFNGTICVMIYFTNDQIILHKLN